DAAKLRRGVVNGVIFELQQRAELLLVELADTLLDILPKHKIKKRLQFLIIPGENVSSAGLHSFGTRNRRERVGDISQNIEQIAFLGIDHAADFGKLLAGKSLFGKTREQHFARIRVTPYSPKLI